MGSRPHVARRLALRHRPTLVLVGRTPETEEDPATATAAEPAALRALLIERRRARGGELKPALIERECRRIMHERELRQNLHSLRETGAARRVPSSATWPTRQAFGGADRRRLRPPRQDRRGDPRRRPDRGPAGQRQVARLAAARDGRQGRCRAERSRGGCGPTRCASWCCSARSRAASETAARPTTRPPARCSPSSPTSSTAAGPARVVAIDWGPWRSAGMVSAALERQFERRGVRPDRTRAGMRAAGRRAACGDARARPRW